MNVVIFEPHTTFSVAFIVLVIGIIVGITLTVWGLAKHKQVVPLLGFVLLLVCTSSAYMTHRADAMVGNVQIEEDALLVGNRTYSFEKLRGATLTTMQDLSNQPSLNMTFAQPNDRILVIELTEGDPLIIPAHFYAIDSLKTVLDERVNRWFQLHK